MKKTLIALSLSALPCFYTLAEQTPTVPTTKQQHSKSDHTLDKFFEDSERGWYWYEQLPEKEKEKFREKMAQSMPSQKEQKQKKSKQEDIPLSTAWFKANFEKYKNAAIDNPYDKEAMRTYLYLEKYMRDRAVTFAYQRQKAVMAEPFLDATAVRPLASFGIKAMNVAASQNRDAILKALGANSGIYFFYRADDVFSEKQAPIVKLLEKKYGFAIKPVSMDGKPVAKELWDNNLTDSGQAAALGVKQVPALYLFNPNNGAVSLISQGLQSLPDLKVRLVYAAERAGLITEQQADTIRSTGLYKDVNGNVTGGFPFPENAPDTFKEFYKQSLEQQGQ